MILLKEDVIPMGVKLKKLRALIAMADYFDTSVDYLIGHTDIPHVIEEVQPHELNAQEEMLLKGFRVFSFLFKYQELAAHVV